MEPMREIAKRLSTPEKREPFYIAGIVGALALATHRSLQNSNLAEQAHTDPLTKALNRRGFEKVLNKHAANAAKKPYGVFVLDLDRFKKINDGFGHTAGDDLLITVTGAVSDIVRENDAVAHIARIGGDELAVVLDMPSKKRRLGLRRDKGRRNSDAMPQERLDTAVNRLGEELHTRVFENPELLAKYPGLDEIEPSVSIGAALGTPGQTGIEVYEVADQQMYLAKNAKVA